MPLCPLWSGRNGTEAGPLLDPKLRHAQALRDASEGIERCERRRWAARTALRPILCDLLWIMKYPGKSWKTPGIYWNCVMNINENHAPKIHR